MSDPARASSLPPMLERLAIFLAVFGVVLRWVSGGAAVGTNLFIHLLFWVAPALWLVARALGGGATWRFSGAEFPLLAFCIVSLLSAQRADHKLPALDRALAILSFALLFVFLASAVGRETILSLLGPTLFAVALYAIVQRVWYLPRLLTLYDPAVQGPMSSEMKWRIETHRVFSVFVGPNQLGGFLALLLPIVAASLMEARARLLKAIPLVLGVAALALTRSFGATAGLLAGIVTFAVLWRTREKGRALVVGTGLALAGVAILVVLFTPLLAKIGERSFSMHVRRAYWQAAGTMIARAPVLGVGLDNYQDFYPQDKTDTQTETRYAHNDYLQVLAETGIVGGLAFAALVAFALRRALARGEAAAPASAPLPPWLLPMAAGAACLAAAGFGTLDADVAFIIGVAWIGWHLLERRSGVAAVGPATRIGAAAGLVAILVHMTVDFDLYETSLACFFFVSLALVTMLQGKASEVRLPPSVCGAVAAVLLLVVFPLLTLATPRALSADSEVEQARRDLHELEAGARRGRSATQLIDEIDKLARSAQDHNPLLVEAYLLQAEGEARAWSLTPKGAASLPRLQRHEDMALQALENGIRLNPRSAFLHAFKAQLHGEFAKSYAPLAPTQPLAEARRQEHSRQALRDQELAVGLYPTFAPHRAALARLLEEDGRRDEAVAHYREALRLSDLAARERYPLERMQVDRPVIRKALDDILRANHE